MEQIYLKTLPNFQLKQITDSHNKIGSENKQDNYFKIRSNRQNLHRTNGSLVDLFKDKFNKSSSNFNNDKISDQMVQQKNISIVNMSLTEYNLPQQQETVINLDPSKSKLLTTKQHFEIYENSNNCNKSPQKQKDSILNRLNNLKQHYKIKQKHIYVESEDQTCENNLRNQNLSVTQISKGKGEKEPSSVFQYAQQIIIPSNQKMSTSIQERQLKINNSDKNQQSIRLQNSLTKQVSLINLKSQSESNKISSEYVIRQEQLNQKFELSKKFLMCSEYEAHRNYKSDVVQAEKIFLLSIENMKPLFNDQLNILKSTIIRLKNMQEIDNLLTNLDIFAVQSKNGFLQVAFLLLHSKISFEYHDYVKCIHLAKKSKNLAQVYGYLYEKMNCYEIIAKAFTNLQKHKISIIYQIKVLRLSWLLVNESKELKAYDELGKCYYYLGDIQRAHYFHEKMMNGKIEKDISIKQLSNSKLQNRSYLSSSSLYNRKIQKGKTNLSSLNQPSKSKIGIQTIDQENHTEEEDLVSSSDDEFEIHLQSKESKEEENGLNLLNQSQTNSKLYKTDNLGINTINQFAQKSWDDKLIMARLRVLQIQRSKEIAFSGKIKQRSDLWNSETNLDLIGSAICKIDLKNKEYLSKLLQKRGKATTIQKKYRISHLTPNRSILQYHEAESQFLKLKNYSSIDHFIPTLDSLNLKKIQEIINKIIIFLQSAIYQIQQKLSQCTTLKRVKENEKQNQMNQQKINFKHVESSPSQDSESLENKFRKIIQY